MAAYKARSKRSKSPYPKQARNIVERNPFAGGNAGAEIRNGGTMRAEDSPRRFDPKRTLRRKDLYLPATARRPDNEVAREQQQMLDEMEAVRGSLKYYQQRLDEQYNGVKVMLAKPHTTIEGLKPGYYHLIYDVPECGNLDRAL
jgi:hypothetical protein